MTVNDVMLELVGYGFTFEEAYRIYKCIAKKRYNVLDMFEKDLEEKIGSKEARLVIDKLKQIPVETMGINPLHSLVYNMSNKDNTKIQ